jgi:hypothetical protein
MPTTTLDTDEPLGVAEVAELLGVKDRTVHMWKYREIMPSPDWPEVNRSHAWRRGTILAWAAATNRLRSPEVAAQWSVARKDQYWQDLSETLQQ